MARYDNDYQVRTGILGCICIFLAAGTFYDSLVLSGGRQTYAVEWARPAFWDAATCRVLNTGRAYRGTCDAYDTDANGEPMGECPGTYWCADEGGTCQCPGGEVTFGQGGNQDQSWRGPGITIKVVGQSEVPCSQLGIDDVQLGFREDPAPGVRKTCWCTPADVLAVLDGRDPEARSCGQRADTAWSSALGASSMEAVPGGNATEFAQQPGDEEDDAEEDLEVEDLPQGESRLVEMSKGHRRRHGCAWTYMPWALVEVKTDYNPFFSSDSDTKPKLRCAYEFGAPHNSRDPDYGALGVAMSEEETRWGRAKQAGAELACTVREGTDTCVVAMQPLSQLEERIQVVAGENFFYAWFYLGVGVMCSGSAYACWNEEPGTRSLNQSLVTTRPPLVPPLRRQVSQALLGRQLSQRLHGDADSLHTGDHVELLTRTGDIPAGADGIIALLADEDHVLFTDNDSGESLEVRKEDVRKCR